MRRLAIDETSRQGTRRYVTLFADADPDPERRRCCSWPRGREAETVQAFAANLRAHAGKPAVFAIGIDMSPAFIKGVEADFPTHRSPSTSST
ncbi:MAG: transposase [Steroidobacteraceae bacterium]